MSTLEVGRSLGGYRILERLRAGGMGILYLAQRAGATEFSRRVAIKVIHDHLAQNSRFARMFIDEAKVSAHIDHPNVVRVEEFGQADGRYYLVMEYVHGVSLAQALGVLHASGRVPIELAVAMAVGVAGGLHGAHEATDEMGVPLGIVHRDVSPHNVLVSYTGAVRLIDFGIAKTRQVGGQTRTGSLRGKLAYMPPEQARSARTVDRRADLYGLGLVLWEMLTTRRAFDAPTELALFDQIRNPKIVPPSALAPSVPKALDDVVMRMLALDPEARPQTGLELQRALLEALPAAARVLPSDIGALMLKVRATATSLALGQDDPSGLYGEEIRRTLTILGKGMHERLEEDPQPRESGAPRRRDGAGSLALASVIVANDAGIVVEDEATWKMPAPPVMKPFYTPDAPLPVDATIAGPGRSSRLAGGGGLTFERKELPALAILVVVTALSLIALGMLIGNGPAGGDAPGAQPKPSAAGAARAAPLRP